ERPGFADHRHHDILAGVLPGTTGASVLVARRTDRHVGAASGSHVPGFDQSWSIPGSAHAAQGPGRTEHHVIPASTSMLPGVSVAEVRNLRAYYVTMTSNTQRTVRAVDDISLEIREGEVYGIAGESG